MPCATQTLMKVRYPSLNFPATCWLLMDGYFTLLSQVRYRKLAVIFCFRLSKLSKCQQKPRIPTTDQYFSRSSLAWSSIRHWQGPLGWSWAVISLFGALVTRHGLLLWRRWRRTHLRSLQSVFLVPRRFCGSQKEQSLPSSKKGAWTRRPKLFSKPTASESLLNPIWFLGFMHTASNSWRGKSITWVFICLSFFTKCETTSLP